MKNPTPTNEKTIQLWIVLITVQITFDIVMVGLLDYSRATTNKCARDTQATSIRLNNEIDSLRELDRNNRYDAAINSLASMRLSAALHQASEFYEDMGFHDKAIAYRITADGLMKSLKE